MEKINNYKLKEFLNLKDIDLIKTYLSILEHLKPLKSISNPRYRFYNREPKTLHIKAVRTLSFGEVIEIRNIINTGTFESIVEILNKISGLKKNEILNLRIVQYFGILSFIKNELIELNNIELNELSDDSSDINYELVNASERMAKFGVLNVINSLAKEDVLRWSRIEKLPYMTVLTKLLMDKEKNKIQQEIAELQKKKTN